MRVRDVMETDVTTVREDVPLEVALELMRWHGVRHLPVLREGRLVGALTDRDLVRALAAGRLGGSVGASMDPELRAVAPDLPVAEAAGIVAADPVGCVAVLDGERLIGTLTASDLLRTAPRRPAPSAAEEAWRP